jgi:hypothetical protein
MVIITTLIQTKFKILKTVYAQSNKRFHLLDGMVNGILEEWIKWGWNSGPNESYRKNYEGFSNKARREVFIWIS